MADRAPVGQGANALRPAEGTIVSCEGVVRVSFVDKAVAP
jgi:hypothetical protein